MDWSLAHISARSKQCLIAVSLSSLLLACDSSSVSNPGSATNAGNEPESEAATQTSNEEIHPAIEAYYRKRDNTQNAYSGVRDELGLTAESLPVFFNTTMYGSFPQTGANANEHVHLSDWTEIAWHEMGKLPFFTNHDQFPNDLMTKTDVCNTDGTGGTYSIKSNVIEWEDEVAPNAVFNHYVYSIDYDNCSEYADSMVFNGNVSVFLSTVQAVDASLVSSGTPTIFYFNNMLLLNDLTLTRNEAQVQVNGAIAKPMPAFCNGDGQQFYTILAQNLRTGTSVLMDDFMHGWYVGKQGFEQSSCHDKTLFPNIIDGQVFHSEYGLAKVTTTDDGFLSEIKESNLLQLASANSSAIFEDDDVGPTRFDLVGGTRARISVTLNRSDTQSTDSFKFLKNSVLHGAFTDLGDLDNDGMPNSWETYYDLDPNNEADAGIDSDNDALSNADEYNMLADPLSQGHTGNAINFRADLRMIGLDKPAKRVRISAGVSSTGAAIGELRTDNFYTLSASEPGHWTHIPSFCTVATEQNLLVCASHTDDEEVYTDPHNPGFVQVFTAGFAATTDSTLEITLSIAQEALGTRDFWPSNNDDVMSIIMR